MLREGGASSNRGSLLMHRIRDATIRDYWIVRLRGR
jgi:hypothetical protein